MHATLKCSNCEVNITFEKKDVKKLTKMEQKVYTEEWMEMGNTKLKPFGILLCPICNHENCITVEKNGA